MSPLAQLLAAIRPIVAERRGATETEIEQLRQLAVHVIDHDLTPVDVTRTELRDALDTTDRPDARSFVTDSGLDACRRPS
jgi:hypothetical protein